MKKTLLILLGLLLVGGVSAIGFTVLKDKKTLPGTGADEPETKSDFPLKIGSTGEKVKQLQRYINSKMLAFEMPLDVDGIFGPATLTQLKFKTGLSEVSEAKFNELMA